MSGGDGVVTYRHGIAIGQLVLFSVAMCFAVYFKLRYRNGWFCIGVFSAIRVIGAGCMLGTISKDSDGLWAAVFVCESLGMVMMVILLLEFLYRANKLVPTIHPRWFFYPQVLTWADLGLAIGGFAAASRNEHPLAPTKYTQASFGLFTGLYLIVCYTAWCFWRRLDTFAHDERLLIRCVAVCLPLLGIRTAYSLVFQITGDMAWNAVKGNPTPYLTMTVLTELGIIYVSIWAIMRVVPPPRKQRKDKNRGGPNEEQGYALVGSATGSRERLKDDDTRVEVAR
ncbi:hypothetical protein VTK26DRAFT_5858 [Humicola hyalothermophila]